MQIDSNTKTHCRLIGIAMLTAPPKPIPAPLHSLSFRHTYELPEPFGVLVD